MFARVHDPLVTPSRRRVKGEKHPPPATPDLNPRAVNPAEHREDFKLNLVPRRHD